MVPQPDAEAKAKGEQIFRRGQRCYEELNYSCAETSFREALNYSRDPQYHVFLAYTYAATDRQRLAVDEFKKSLELNPDFTVDSETQSPKIVRAWELARSEIESEKEAARQSVIRKGTAFLDELFRETISTVAKPFLPEKPQGLMWGDVPLARKSRYTIAAGFNVPVDDRYAGRNDAFEPDIALMGAYTYHPEINHFAFGTRVIYSRNKQRDATGPVSLDIVSASGFLELHHPVEVFLLFGRAEAGAVFSGIDNIRDKTGLLAGGSAGVAALVTDRVSLEISTTFQAMFGAGVPGRNPSYRAPFFFGLNYLY
ncbi:MAG: hypothetical protein KIT79_01945 [Deltaproteobacteria bacterium]|nr:hypothetical protein [Deltaproteobacteria bacterium]